MNIPLSIPTEGFIKLKAVQQITALSRSTILRRIAENKFPKPIKYGNILLFSVDTIRKFINDLKEQQTAVVFDSTDLKENENA